MGAIDKTETYLWTTHGQRESTEREKLAARDTLRVDQSPTRCAVSVLMAGAVASTAANSGMSAIVVHAVASDGASLCDRVPAAALLEVDGGLWSSVPGYERCLECSVLAGAAAY